MGSETLPGYGKLTFKFKNGTQVVMHDAKSVTNGTYTANGKNITLNFGAGVVYSGAITGDRMAGTARNGRTNWTWQLTRQGGGVVAPPGDRPPGGDPQPPGGFGGGGLGGSPLAFTQWTGSQTLAGFGKLQFVFLNKDRVIMDDSRETSRGTFQVNGQEVTLKFFSGDLVYTGTINGGQMEGTAKDQSGSWNFSVSHQPSNGRLEINLPNTSTGTGSLVDRKHRLIMTNVHVVGDAETVIVHFPDYDKGEPVARRDLYKRKEGIQGKVVLREERIDLALIQLEKLPDGVKPLSMAKKSGKPGQQVHSVGNPGVSKALWVYSPGRVRQCYQTKWEIKDEDLGTLKKYDGMRLETDSPINPGDSGGPLVNERGVMVGVAHASYDPGAASNFSIFIDVSEARALLAKYYQAIGETYAPEPEPAAPGAVAALSDHVKGLSHEDYGQRMKAAQALGEMGDSASPAFGLLFQALKDKHNLVQRAALDALDKVPPHKGDLGMLCTVCKDAGELAEVRLQAVKALAKLGADARTALPVLLGLLKEKDDGLRQAAMASVVAIGADTRDVAALTDALTNPSPEIRRLSMQALAKLGSQAKGAVPAVAAALKTGDKASKMEALKTLEAFGPAAKEAVPALTDALKDTDSEVGLGAARALARLGEHQAALPYLVDGLKNGNQDLKRSSIQALATLGQEAKSASALLSSALEDEALRTDAAEALVKIGRRSVTAVSKVVSKSANAQARLAGIEVLGRIATAERLGPPYRDQALIALRTILQGDPVRENREAAQKAGLLIESRK
jgi:HEAT repeat protein/S1-C subfamily serine protease